MVVHRLNWETASQWDVTSCRVSHAHYVVDSPAARVDEGDCLRAVDEQSQSFAAAGAREALDSVLPLIGTRAGVLGWIEVRREPAARGACVRQCGKLPANDRFWEVHRDAFEDEQGGLALVEAAAPKCLGGVLDGEVRSDIGRTGSGCSCDLVLLRRRVVQLEELHPIPAGCWTSSARSRCSGSSPRGSRSTLPAPMPGPSAARKVQQSSRRSRIATPRCRTSCSSLGMGTRRLVNDDSFLGWLRDWAAGQRS